MLGSLDEFVLCWGLLTSLLCAQDEYILSRRYADRWMRKALKVGLHKRALLRKERNNRGERLREVAFLASLQKGRVLRAGKVSSVPSLSKHQTLTKCTYHSTVHCFPDWNELNLETRPLILVVSGGRKLAGLVFT